MTIIIRTISVSAALLLIAGATSGQHDTTADSLAVQQQPVGRPVELLRMPVYSIEEGLILHNGVAFDVRPCSRYFRVDDSQWGERAEREMISVPELYIRGGRLHDNGYLLNGVPLGNPMSGNMTTRISPHAISGLSFSTGCHSSEFGRANSAIIDATTPRGPSAWTAMMEAVSDNLVGSGYDRNWYTASAAGPVPGLDRARFFGLMERRWQADREPSALSKDPLPGNWLRGWSYNGRADYDFSDRLGLTVTADGSRDEWQEYWHIYHFDTRHTPYYRDDNLALRTSLNYDRSAKTRYALSATYYRSERFRGDGEYREDLLAYSRPGGYDAHDDTELFRHGDDPSTPIVWESRWICTDTATINGVTVGTDSVFQTLPVDGDESAPWPDYLRHQSFWIGLDGRVTTRIGVEHTLTAGFEFRRHTVRFYRNYAPTNSFAGLDGTGFDYINRYGYDPLGNVTDNLNWRNQAKHPVNVGLFVKDRYESEGATFTPSVRLGYFTYDASQIRNPENPLDPDSTGAVLDPVLKREHLEPMPSLVRLSPRLAIEFPADERTRMFARAGVHFQNAPYGNLYVGYDFLEQHVRELEYLAWMGTLRPQLEKATNIELGLVRKLSPKVNLKATLFLKKTSNLQQTYTQNSDLTRYFAFRHIDESTVRGVELAVNIASSRYLRFDLRYTHSYADGSGPYSTPQADTYIEPPAESAPLDFDQRHKFVGLMYLEFGEGEGPRIGRSRPLENLKLTVVARVTSGLRYTPMALTNVATERPSLATTIETGKRNSEIMPTGSSIDLRAERSFRAGSFTIVPFVWVKNLLDRKNVANVWASSGEAETTGWLATESGREWVVDYATPDYTGLTGEEKYRLKESQPEHYHTPREVYFGLGVRF